ncbi:Poly(A) polymerase central domain-containing protein [Whalleya microplaca]|nr:Poly(A) polymerase central domain-containing protein [Whalleya microplaca]
MRPLPGDDPRIGRQRPADHDPAPLMPSAFSNQMSFFLADESAVDTYLDQSHTRPRLHDLRKAADSAGGLSLRHDDKDGEASKQASRQPERDYYMPAYSPISRDSAYTRSPASLQSHYPQSVSRPVTPIMLGTSCMGSALSSPSSRRNSFTGSLSENAVSSDDEPLEQEPSYMLGSGSAPQLVMPSIKMPSRRPFTETGRSLGRLKLLVAGDSGIGKTSLVKAIVQMCEHIVHVDPIPMQSESKRSNEMATLSRRTSNSMSGTSEIYASTKPYPEWWSELDDPLVSGRRKSLGDSVLERNICFVDTPGFRSGSSVRPKACAMETIVPCVEYVESHLNRISSDDLNDSDMLNMLGGGGGFQVDVVFYLISQRMKPADLEYIRRLAPLTNVIPLLAQADLLSPQELAACKQEIAGQFRNANIRPFSFTPSTFQGSTKSVPVIPYAISNATGSDHDVMDASLLMSPDYVQPLISSELSYLVEKIFSPNGASWIRHNAAKKYLDWRATTSSRPRHLYRPLTFPAPVPSSALVQPPGNMSSSSWALARVHDQQPRFHVVDWAADLQRSMASERSRYEALARGERAVWLTEKLNECVQDGTLVAVNRSREISPMRRRNNSQRGTWKRAEQHQDPLGLLEVAADLKARGWVALELLGSLGVIGGLAIWLSRQHWPSMEPVQFADEWARLYSMATQDKTWGITPPISVALPTAAETRSTDVLLDELKRQDTFETQSETLKRKTVLDDLQRIADEFVKRVAKEKEPRSEVLIRDARGEIFTYGSYCLGVFGPGSDIDTLVTAPRYVTRADYFKYFPGLLQEMAPKGAVTGLTAVEDAFVPIIKFEYWGISIDLIFSRIATLTQFPPHGQLKLTNNEYLRGLDEFELRSLNGTRVTNEILNLVPEQSTFRLALRAIKLWAQRRAIYANIIGFPGGVVWAMMVARVCQLYPKATSATIVSKFFQIMKNWPWPQPVQLKHPDEGPLHVRVWNPKVYKSDSYHLMPVITPAYPQMCATYNITRSTKSIIQRELERGANITDKIRASKLAWKDLFVKHTFFTTDHKYYLAVIATSLTKDAHKIWSGFVESKVRVLVGNLEQHNSVALARPYNKGYERLHVVKNDAETEAVQNGSLAFLVQDDEDSDGDSAEKKENGLDSPAKEGSIAKKEDGAEIKAEVKTEVKVEDDQSATPNIKSDPENENDKMEELPTRGTKIYTTTHYVGLELAEGAKSLDLSPQVNHFKAMCSEWEKCDTKLNFLSVQHVKNTNLPDDVFEPGEVKPTRPLRRVAANGNPASGHRKRNAPSSEVNAPPAKRPQTSLPTSAAAAG